MGRTRTYHKTRSDCRRLSAACRSNCVCSTLEQLIANPLSALQATTPAPGGITAATRANGDVAVNGDEDDEQRRGNWCACTLPRRAHAGGGASIASLRGVASQPLRNQCHEEAQLHLYYHNFDDGLVAGRWLSWHWGTRHAFLLVLCQHASPITTRLRSRAPSRLQRNEGVGRRPFDLVSVGRMDGMGQLRRPRHYCPSCAYPHAYASADVLDPRAAHVHPHWRPARHSVLGGELRHTSRVRAGGLASVLSISGKLCNELARWRERTEQRRM